MPLGGQGSFHVVDVTLVDAQVTTPFAPAGVPPTPSQYTLKPKVPPPKLAPKPRGAPFKQPAGPPAPTGPPIPVLQTTKNYHGSVTDINQRTQAVTDAYTTAYGQPPSPALTLDVVTSPLTTDQFPQLFTVPKNPLAAKNRGILNQQGYVQDPMGDPFVTAQQVSDQLTKAASQPGGVQAFVAQHSTVLDPMLKDPATKSKVAGAIFQAQRAETINKIKAQLDSGKISRDDAQEQLHEAGIIPWGPAKGAFGLFEKTGNQIAESLVHSPAGIYEVGKAIGLDTADTFINPTAPEKFARTKKLGKAIGESYKADVEHPGQNPGYLFLDALGFLSAGAGGVARAGEVGDALRAGDLGGAAKAAIVKPPLQRATLKYGSMTEEMPLSANPLVAAAQKVVLNHRQARFDKSLAVGEDPAGLRSILLPGAAQDVLDKELSFPKKISREADARKRTDHIVQMTLSRELDHVAGRSVMTARVRARLPAKLRGALTRGEQKAIQVLSTDDPNPLQSWREFHQTMIDMNVGDPFAHRVQLADLKLAEKALANPSPRLVHAVQLTLAVVDRMQDIKINDLGLRPETAEGRIAKLGQAIRGEDLTGGERVNPDSFYLPTQLRGKVKRPPSDRAGFYSGKAGPFGIPPGRPLPELSHEFTGKAIQAGDIRIDSTSLASEAYGRTVRAATVKAEHNTLWNAASATPRSRFDIPIRDANAIPDALRKVVARLDEGDFTSDDAAILEKTDHEDLIKHLYPPDTRGFTAEEMQNVKWVDSRLLGEGNQLPHVPGLGAKIAQTIQSPFRFTMLYLRPAYILNKLGNAAMLFFDQGVMAAPNMVKAMRAEKLFGEENARTVRALVGAGRSESYVTSSSGKISHAVADFWARVADRDERVASFVHYASKKGYKNEDDYTRLLNDTKSRADLNEIKRRANKALVEFDNLTPIEKNYIRHWVFVYPWVSRSAVWSIRAIMEHPVETDLLAQLGREDIKDDPLWKLAPEYFKEIGYVPIGYNHDGSPKIVNPTSVNTFSTLGDFLGLVRGATIGDKYNSLEDFLGPLPTYFVHAATGRDQYGDVYKGSQWLGAAKEVFAGLPQLAAWDKAHPRANGAARPFDVTKRASLVTSLNANLKRTVLSPGWLDGYGSLLVGGLAPRTVDMDALAARYWRDATPEQRHVRELDLLNKALDVQGTVLGKAVPAPVRSAVHDQAQMTYQWSLFLKKTGRAPTDKERALFTVDYLKKQGLITNASAAKSTEQLNASTDVTDINHIKNALLDDHANGKALRQWDEDVRTVASFTATQLNPKLASLHAQGLSQQTKTSKTQDQLYAYGQKYVAFTHEVKALQAEIKAGTKTNADLRAFQDEHDKPVDGLPSFVRISWANLAPVDQQKAITRAAVKSWGSLTAFDKAILGRPSDAKVTKGWATLDDLIKTQRTKLEREGSKFPSGYGRTLSAYVQKYFDAPGLVADYDFAHQPLYARLKMLKPIQDSQYRTDWTSVFAYAAQKSAEIKSGNYNSTELRQQWRDYVSPTGGLGEWLTANPGFKAEVDSYGKNVLAHLIG